MSTIPTTKKQCASCGNCCTKFWIAYPKKKGPWSGEVDRFRMLDTDKIWVEEHGDSFLVVFDFPCKHVKKTEEGWLCNIYDSRPEICRQYPRHYSQGEERYCAALQDYAKKKPKNARAKSSPRLSRRNQKAKKR